MSEFIKGVDVSVLAEVEQLGGKFYSEGQPCDLFDLMREKGINSLRLRIWNDPYDKDGNPYGGGTTDYATMLALAKRGAAAGMSFCLDFHYSDFWCDPGKQTMPKAWVGLSPEQVAEKVYEFTRSTLCELKKDGIVPKYIQVGNEITHGMLWPLGMYDGKGVWEGEPEQPLGTTNMISFIQAGCKACREVCSDAKIILHLDNGGDHATCNRWFADVTAAGTDFDLIGLSYYPVYHGTFDQLQYNAEHLSADYGKKVVITETSYGFCTERPANGIVEGGSKDFMFAEQSVEVCGIELTPAGQAQFMTRLFELIKKINDRCIIGIYYWEPAWLPVDGSEWAKQAGRDYVNDKGGGGNEWANQCMFDYEGNALPAWDVIRDFEW